jgi:hypothetical protein
MKYLVSRIVVALLVMLPVSAGAQDDIFLGGFDGRWEGALASVPADQYSADHGVSLPPNQYAFMILGRKVKVYYKDKDDNWRESKPGLFQIVTHKTNATISVINSSQDVEDKTGSGGWVETQAFSLTHKDRRGLYVSLTQTVSNYLHPHDYKSGDFRGRFFVIRFGEMSLVE